MKMLFLMAILLGSASAWAANGCVDANGKDISSSPEVFQDLISKQTECDAAASLAEACAWGSSMDLETVSRAYTVCDNQLKGEQPSPSDQALLKSMADRCDKQYSNMEGTLYLSVNAYCHLSAIRWLEGLLAP